MLSVSFLFRDFCSCVCVCVCVCSYLVCVLPSERLRESLDATKIGRVSCLFASADFNLPSAVAASDLML